MNADIFYLISGPSIKIGKLDPQSGHKKPVKLGGSGCIFESHWATKGDKAFLAKNTLLNLTLKKSCACPKKPTPTKIDATHVYLNKTSKEAKMDGGHKYNDIAMYNIMLMYKSAAKHRDSK